MYRQIPIEYKRIPEPRGCSPRHLTEFPDSLHSGQAVTIHDERDDHTHHINAKNQDDSWEDYEDSTEENLSQAVDLPAESVEVEKLKEELVRSLNREEDLLKEFKNYRRHSEEALSNAEIRSKREVLADLADVVHALDLAKEATQCYSESYIQGLEMIVNSMKKVFSDHGLYRIKSVDQPFDPKIHEAVMTQRDGRCKKGTVIRELLPGIYTDDEVIRPAKVVVST